MSFFNSNITYLLLLIFFLITFSQSGIDKLANWKGNLEWLKGHFSKSFFKNKVPFLLGTLTVMELLTAVFCIWGIYELLAHNKARVSFYAAILSVITLLMLFFGQRVAKDYDGARTIVIYLIPAFLLVFFTELEL